jgi:hypothetical protein
MVVGEEPLRLLVGLAVAAVLVAVALWLLATTDWSGPDGDDPFDRDRP